MQRRRGGWTSRGAAPGIQDSSRHPSRLAQPHCSFCGLHGDGVDPRPVIATPAGAAICADCAQVAVTMLRESEHGRPLRLVADQPGQLPPQVS